MHPRLCDSINRMANLPQFYEWVNERGKVPGSKKDGASRPGSADASRARIDPEGTKKSLKKVQLTLKQIFSKSIQEWNKELPEMKTDDLLGDSSINNIIFTKLKEVFSALVDAATLAGSCARTRGSCSRPSDTHGRGGREGMAWRIACETGTRCGAA